MFKVVESVLASALAASGTLQVSYPSGTNAGSFTGGVGHKLVTSSGNVFDAPKYFTAAFGASAITLTWGSSSPTLPVGTRCFIQLEMPGYSSQAAREGADPAIKRTAGISTKLINLGSPIVADADGVAASQTVTGAGTAFVINGALASGGVATFDVPRNVVAAWTNAAVLTITGKDEYGNTMVEVSASGTSHTGKKAFKTVTSVTTSATVTSATVGSGSVLGLPVFLPAKSAILDERLNGVSFNPPSKVYVPFSFTGTQLDTPTPMELVSPVNGRISGLRAVVVTAGTTGGALTVEVETTAVDGLTVTIADAAAAGTRYSDVPSSPTHATTAVSIGSRIRVVPAAAFNASGPITGWVEIEAETVQGTVVVGNASAAQSGTSNDVRGTYAPLQTMDGALSFELVLALQDPDFTGFPQYAG